MSEKENLELFNKKYGLVIIDGSRYYKADLTKHQMIFENSSPFYFQCGQRKFITNVWKDLVIEVLQFLDAKNPKSVDELMSFKLDWKRQDVFSTEKRINYTYFRKGLYLNTNNTAIHSVWLIQYFLEKYNIDMNQCELYIRRFQGAEPYDVQSYYIFKNKNAFKKLLARRGKSEKSIDTIIRNIDSMSLHLLKEKTSTGKNEYDFFMFDNYKLFKSCKNNAISYAKKYYDGDEEKIHIVKNNLDILDDYYKIDNDTKESMKYVDFID